MTRSESVLSVGVIVSVVLACAQEEGPHVAPQLVLHEAVSGALSPAEAHEFRLALTAGEQVTVEAMSLDLDVVLELHGPGGWSAVDDNGLAGTDARLSVAAVTAGEHRVIVRSADGFGGPYSLVVRDGVPPAWDAEARVLADEAYFAAALQRAAATTDRRRGLAVRLGLGEAKVARGAYEEAVRVFREAIDLLGEDAAVPARVRAHGGLGFALSMLRRFEEAEEPLLIAVELADEAADVQAGAHFTGYLGGTYLYRGEPDKAAAMLAHAEELAVATGDDAAAARWARQLGRTWLLLGRSDEAEPPLLRALERFQDAGAGHDAARVREMVARIAADRGRYSAAIDLLAPCIVQAEQEGDQRKRAELLLLRASLLVFMGRLEEAAVDQDQASIAVAALRRR